MKRQNPTATQYKADFEWQIGVGILLLGTILRLVFLNRSAVEHFDEGVYASVLWHDQITGSPWPSRELYAPPMTGLVMRLLNLLPGLHSWVPMLPALIAGILTPLVFWRTARAWFGSAAGLFAVAIVSLSDFHIFYSRTALTDVPVLLFIILSVNRGIFGIQNCSVRSMILAGLFCGAAWWTKYTGWLPLAIVASGSGLWWVWRGRRNLSFFRWLWLITVMAATAAVVWSPWYFHLSSVGGYSQVARNHASYLAGFSQWRDHFSVHLASQFLMDGLPACLSLGAGLLAAGIHRWIMASHSTWNNNASDAGPDPVIHEHERQASSGRKKNSVVSRDSNRGDVLADTAAERNPVRHFRPRHVLNRFIIAAASLTLIAFTVWTPLLLCCLGIGGVSGIFLWQVLQRLHGRSLRNDLTPVEPGAVPNTAFDLWCASSINPDLAACTVVTWFFGMLITTPLYHPYPRLFLPLAASIWMGASGAIGWWIESTLSVARRPGTDKSGAIPARHSALEKLVGALLILSLTVSLVSTQSVFSTVIHADRTSMLRSARAVLRDVQDDITNPELNDKLPPVTNYATTRGVKVGETIDPDDLPDPEDLSLAASIAGVPDSEDFESKAEPDPGTRRNSSIRAMSDPRAVIYVYGEPALLYHLNQLGNHQGIIALPVSHLQLRAGSERRPTFLIFGPHAIRSGGFFEQWLRESNGYRLIREVRFRPSILVMLDLFSPMWLRNHPEA
ncbi:MAG: ArnT family glycosyltransferase [Planctomyces sp.]